MTRIQGSRAVVVLLAAGVLLGAYAWWNAFQRGRMALEVWGSEAAVRIRYAERVELWELDESQSQAAEAIDIGEMTFAVARKTDISDAKGLVHARHALVEDASFVWPAKGRDPPHTADRDPDWQFALHFVHDDGNATVAFDTGCGEVWLVPGGASLMLQPHLISAYRDKSKKWRADPASSPIGQ